MKLQELITYTNEKLKISKYPDPAFINGLTIEGREEISKIAGIVSPSMKIFKELEEFNPDLILSHHGLLFTKGKPITGLNKSRTKFLLDKEISLATYHIPLDADPELGNNIQIAKKLNLENIKEFGYVDGYKIGFSGDRNISSLEELSELIKENLNQEPFEIFWPEGKASIKRTAIVSGAAAKQYYFEECARNGIDCFITGTIDEYIRELSNELGIVFVSLGHYKSERWGIKALGSHLAEKFSLEFKFFETDEIY